MSSVDFVLHAGPHPRQDCPVIAALPCPEAVPPSGVRVRTEHGEEWPAQVCEAAPEWCGPSGQEEARVAFLLPQLAAGASVRLTAEFGDFPAAPPQVTVADPPGLVDIKVREELLTTYRYLGNPARPCFYPVLGPGGLPLTRRWPLEESAPEEPQDHPHHRSLWVAHGAVNRTDNWSEEPNHGYQLPHSILGACSGAVLGQLTAMNTWTDSARRPVLEEVRALTAYAVSSECRLFDFDVTFLATECDVRFGDTKEGGIIAFRVAPELTGDRGGRIENSYGGVGEAECWGKRAHWCDYSGQVNGAPCGIAIFDHPRSFRHPTNWHVRDYGMFTANPFGWHDFHNDPALDGSHLLPRGSSLSFSYRVFLHRGHAQEAGVAARYHDYAHPPTVEVG